MEAIVGFILGIVGGLASNALWSRRRRFSVWLLERRGQGEHPLSYDPRDDGFYVINRWSPARTLSRERLETLVVENRPSQRWFNEARYRKLVAQFSERYSGDICYLVDYDIDSWESERSERFRVYVARCGYAEHLATAEYLRNDPAAARAMKKELDDGDLAEFARSAPPSSISMNVALVNDAGKFLALQRSSAVQAAKNQWTIGPDETMKIPARHEPGRSEDLFSLGERCLKEELGLDREHYEDIVISWIGYYLPLAKVSVKAMARTHLSEREVEERVASSHSVFESQRSAWLPFQQEALTEIIQHWQGDSQGRSWTDGSRLVAQEMWRMRPLLRMGAN